LQTARTEVPYTNYNHNELPETHYENRFPRPWFGVPKERKFDSDRACKEYELRAPFECATCIAYNAEQEALHRNVRVGDESENRDGADSEMRVV
jgi:hypothetical protein